jgi:predicted nucleic acid-binding protein
VTAIVVDASAALAWLLKSQATGAASAFLAEADDWTFCAPAIFPWEVHNALLSVERRGLMSRAEHDQALAVLAAFSIEIDEPLFSAGVRAQMEFARSAGLSLFDSAYLSLGLARNCGLASRDGNLLRIAERAGLPCHDLRDESAQ